MNRREKRWKLGGRYDITDINRKMKNLSSAT